MTKKTEYLDIGDILLDWRTARKLSRRQLSEMSGVTQGTIVNVEFGKTPPSFVTLSKICHALELPFEDFLSGQHGTFKVLLWIT